MVGGIFIESFIALRRRIQKHKLNCAIRKADWMARRSGNRFFVFRYRKKFLVKSKRELKKLIRDGYFTKGFTIQQAEKIALYRTK